MGTQTGMIDQQDVAPRCDVTKTCELTAQDCLNLLANSYHVVVTAVRNDSTGPTKPCNNPKVPLIVLTYWLHPSPESVGRGLAEKLGA